MGKRMSWSILAVVLALPAVALPDGPQPPATLPASGVDSSPFERIRLVRWKLMGRQEPNEAAIEASFAFQLPSAPQVKFQYLPSPYSNFQAGATGTIRSELREPMTQQRWEKIVADISAYLQMQVSANSSLSGTQRADRLKEIDARIRELAGKKEALEEMQLPYAPSVPREKLSQLHQEQEEIEEKLRAKSSRALALQLALDYQRRLIEDQVRGDAIAVALRELVQMRENDMNAISEKTPNHEAARAALEKARIRLAERENSLRKSDKGDLLDQLSNELVMLGVDEQELQHRLGDISDRLSPYISPF